MKLHDKQTGEIKRLIEEATERRIERICEFHWQRVFGEGKND